MARLADGTADPQVVCITGMHRSGTSLAARMVNVLGVSFGAVESLLPPGADNPAGYWENRAIKELDDELLARLGGSWDQPPVLLDGWESAPELDDLVARAASVIERDLAPVGGQIRGFKDPRICLLAPFWRRVLPICATVVVVRDPREVAASLAQRNGLTEAEAGTLWLRYLLAAVRDCPDPLVVRHHELLAGLPGTLSGIAHHLGVAVPDERVHRLVETHIDRSLVHHADLERRSDRSTNPVLAMAELVWAGGEVDLQALPDAVNEALASGWLAPPGRRAELMAARAEAVDLRERLRKRLREVRGSEPGVVPSP